MQMVKKLLLSIMVLWASIIIFAPKRELYYLLENRLQKVGVVLNGELINTTFSGFKVQKAQLYFQGIKVGEIGEIDFWTIILFSQVDLKNFVPSPGMKKLFDIRLKQAKAKHRLWHPLIVKVEAEGSFGLVDGQIDLAKRNVRIQWLKVGDIHLLKPYLKKDKKGWYYEKSY